MKSKYQSGKSVAKNQTVPIAADDPRLAWNKISQTKARQGSEIDIVGLDGKSLIVGGVQNYSPSGSGLSDLNIKVQDIIIPPINGLPISVYPGQGATIITPTAPTDVSASWSGEDLVVNFNWDYSNDLNKTVSQFILEITADGITKRTPINSFVPNKTQNSQSITLTKTINTQTFGVFRTSITSVCVLAADPLNNISSTTCASSVPAYVVDLPVPTISVSAITSGYSVSYATPTQSSYNAIEIVEYESKNSTEPTGVTYLRTYLGTINPANIIVNNFNKRWVKARFVSNGGAVTQYSMAQSVTPITSVNIDNTPPNEVTQVQASWSGDDVVISYKLPAQDPGVRIQIQLTAPNSLVGYFYRFPDGSSRNQTTTITKKDLFDQFGEHYSSFTGILRSIDSADNRTSGVSFNVPLRANPLAGITPTFTVIGLSNAYSLSFTLPTGASYAEVYASHTNWSGDPSESIVVYSGLSPAVITDTNYTDVYVVIRYYDDFGNTSNYSAKQTTRPLNAGEITSFENPISFGPNAVIFAGNSPTSGTRTLFKSEGIFAYDSANTSPSTQIVSNASAGTPTFITTQAQIADWQITSTKIENTLSGTPSSYVGLSATGTYAFWAGSSVSGGNSSANFTVTPSGAVTARNISIIGNGNASSNLISAGGLFTVKNDGTFTATGANITGTIYAQGGEFTGNVKLNGGSLYALGSGGTVSSGIRTIFNSSGIAAYNASGGYAQMLTTPLADGSVFTATAANIGGWSVDTNRIYKTSITGKGNIEIDSANGYISVSNSSVATAKAGINSPTNSLSDNVFWAGTGGPTSTSNAFRVTLGGQLYASGATISGGTITSSGSLGTVTMDGVNDLISIVSGSSYSYLFPRNNNTYLTSGFPFGGTVASPTYSTLDNLSNSPYFVAGSGFTDRYGASVKGIGIYTGAFTGSETKPFLSATTTGIQIKASENVSFNAEPTNGTTPGITMTSGTSASLTVGGSTGGILVASGSGSTVGAISVNTGVITLLADNTSDGTDSPYTTASKIVLSTNKVQIFGLTAQGDADIIRRVQTNGIHSGYRLGKNNEDLYPLGPYGRQRMIVQNEYTGELLRGMAVYYGRTTDPIGNGTPSDTTGAVGDLFVVY